MEDINKLLELMAALRDPHNGCPWDTQQTFDTIAPHTIEEAYEVADAISRNDMASLREELGDLLFQVVFHARMAEEQGEFEFADVAKAITDKMTRRHPHVFGTDEERRQGQVQGSWERIKASERSANADDSASHSSLDGVALALPALKRAAKLGNRAATAGFDWPDSAGVRDKILEELDELREAEVANSKGQIHEELGDLLFSVVNLARHLGVDAENALSTANAKFEARFRHLELAVNAAGGKLSAMSLSELEAAWQHAKIELQKDL